MLVWSISATLAMTAVQLPRWLQQRGLLPGAAPAAVAARDARRQLAVLAAKAKPPKPIAPEVAQAIRKRLLRKELAYSTHARQRLEHR